MLFSSDPFLEQNAPWVVFRLDKTTRVFIDESAGTETGTSVEPVIFFHFAEPQAFPVVDATSGHLKSVSLAWN